MRPITSKHKLGIGSCLHAFGPKTGYMIAEKKNTVKWEETREKCANFFFKHTEYFYEKLVWGRSSYGLG